MSTETSIAFAGVTVTQPVTVLTDLILAALCLRFAARLGGSAVRSRRWWGLAFAWLTIAFVGGSIDHGFHAYLGADGPVWMLALASNALAGACMMFATARGQIGGRAGRVLQVVAAIGALGYLAYMLTTDVSFRGLVAYYLPGQVLLLVVSCVRWVRDASGAGKSLALGVFVGFAGAAYQLFGSGLHRHMNHNDVFHLIQMVALALFHRGAQRLEDLA